MLRRTTLASLAALTAALVIVPIQLLACERPGFHCASICPRQNAVLSGVLAASRQLRLKGTTPVNVFDLDATIFECGSRHKAILLEYARTHRRQHPGLERAVQALEPDKLPYSILEIAKGLGLEGKSITGEMQRFWRDRFFSNEYLKFDHPIAGAVAYVNALSRAGSAIVYLTGREEALMSAGTHATIAANGFPLRPGKDVVILSHRPGMRDADFKGSAEVRERIAALGTVVGIFDNEPGNVNALQRSFPDAMTVFLDTNHSPDAPALDLGIASIRNFRWSW